MICDTAIHGAKFEVLVEATRELLFENQIYQPRQQRTLDEQAKFLMQDCDVHSLEDATRWVGSNTARLEAVVADTMRPVLTPMGWQILRVNAVDAPAWSVTMEPVNGPARKDEALLQVPRI